MPVRAFRLTVATTLVAFLMLPAAAAAADDLIVVPVSGFAQGAEGDVVTIATVDVPEDIVGSTCQIIGITVNQVSVHPGNDLLINTNGQSFIVPDFEDAGFIEHQAGEVASLGTTIQLQIRFGPDGISSGGFRVRVECDPEVFTTTTEAPTETSTTETTVAEEPPAGPTTEAPTTTGPTTTAPATTVPTTTGPTTTEPEAPNTSVDANAPTTAEEPPAGPTTPAEPTTTPDPPPTTTASEEPPAGPETNDDVSLPVTGSSTGLILSLGAVFVAAGLVLRRFASAAA